MESRSNRKKNERKELRSQTRKKVKYKITDWYEEFKLNREGKTKRKRIDVMARYRKIDRTLTALIVIVGLLLVISWVIILFY